MSAAEKPKAGLVHYRKYQEKIFWDHVTKTMLLHWSRQIGKSYTLAGWAISRLIEHPGRLVTLLSNSRANGQEFVVKVQDICRLLGHAIESDSNAAALDARTDLSEDMKFDAMRAEVRLVRNGKVGRIIVLAANPRTARGFSGDLILDEFAFHENSRLIWEAAEPIISSNPDFLCRIASTGNGKRNMFYQMISEGRIPYHRVRRSDAWAAGEIKIYSAVTGKEITPEIARAESSDKRAYDQNYECAFNDENSALLTQELINQAQRDGVGIDEQTWQPATIARLREIADGEIYLGQDFARTHDYSVQAVLLKLGQTYRIVAMLRMRDVRTPLQREELRQIATLPRFKAGHLDMTGNGLGLVEFSQDEPWGKEGKIVGVNFASTEPISMRLRADGRKAETARVTELMAVALLEAFEDHRIEIPTDPQLRDDLRRPERIVSANGRSVSIAAVRDAAGHADHFWAIALAIRAAAKVTDPGYSATVI